MGRRTWPQQLEQFRGARRRSIMYQEILVMGMEELKIRFKLGKFEGHVWTQEMESFTTAIFEDTPMNAHRIGELNIESIIKVKNDGFSNENW